MEMVTGILSAVTRRTGNEGSQLGLYLSRETVRLIDERSRSPSPTDKQKRREVKSAAKATVKREAELEQARALAELSMYSATDNPCRRDRAQRCTTSVRGQRGIGAIEPETSESGGGDGFT